MIKEHIDIEGEETLEAISNADNFNEWMYSQIEPYAEGKILEIGSGIGNISNFFIEDNKDIVLSDVRDQYIKKLSAKYPNQDVVSMDIVDENFDEKFIDHFGKYDLVFALNVVEHIKDDKQALENIQKLLKANGHMYILVPAYNWLYNSFDRILEHFRRYTKKSLVNILPSNMKIVKTWYFNLAGIFGWLLVGGILKKETIPASNMKLYNTLTPIFRVVDQVTFKKVGLSVVLVSRKK